MEWDNGSGTFNLVTEILVIEFSLEMCFVPNFLAANGITQRSKKLLATNFETILFMQNGVMNEFLDQTFRVACGKMNKSEIEKCNDEV